MGVAATDEAEGAQALFCYLADYVGATKIGNGEWDKYISKDFLRNSSSPYGEFKRDFQKKYPRVIDSAWDKWVETKVSKTKVEDFLESKKSWFVSSVKVAKQLILDIDNASKGVDPQFKYMKAPKAVKVFYKHGDDKVMGLMTKLYKQANATSAVGAAAGIPKPEYFGNPNKWNPADIYFATDIAIKGLETLHSDAEKLGNLKFHDLNTTIGNFIDEGQLLPLSLKQVDLGSNVQFKKVNWMGKAGRAVEEKAISGTKATGAGREEPGAKNPPPAKLNTKWYDSSKSIFIDWNKKYPDQYARDIYIRIQTGKPHNKKAAIQFRHLPARSGKPQKGMKIDIKYPGEPLAGQINGIPGLEKILLTADKTVANALSTIFNRGYTKFESAMNKYNTSGGYYTKEFGLISGNAMYKGESLPKNFIDKNGKDTKIAIPKATITKFNKMKKDMKNNFNDQIGYLSALYIMNDFNAKIAEVFGKSPSKKAHKCVGAIWEYASSRSAKSSPFVIAK